MEKEITPLKEFDKNINYYQLIVRLEEFLVKTEETKSLTDLQYLLNVIRTYIFSEETLKRIYLHNIELCQVQKLPKKDEIEHNTNVLIYYMEKAGFKCILDRNIVIDATNHHHNVIDEYYFPSFYEYISKEKIDTKEKDLLLNLHIDDIVVQMEVQKLFKPDIPSFHLKYFQECSFKILFEFNDVMNKYDYIKFNLDPEFSYFYYKKALYKILFIFISIVKDCYCKQYYKFYEKDFDKVNNSPNNILKDKNKNIKQIINIYFSPNEKKVIEYTQKGYKEALIATEMALSKSRIRQIKQEIKAKCENLHIYDVKPKDLILQIPLKNL